MASDEILQELRSFREEVRGELAAVRAELEELRSQVKTVEFGILTIAQKLLAESEVREIRRKVMAGG